MKVIAVSNSKGGVAKTTTAVTLSCELARRGFRTLLIDADSQGSASIASGIDRDNLRPGLGDVFFEQLPIQQCIRATKVNNLYIVTGSLDLVAFDITFSAATEREYILHTHLNTLEGLDYVIIDTPPQTSLLPINALVASDYYIIPTHATHLAVEGIHTLFNAISWLKDGVGLKAQLLGILLTNVSKTNTNKYYVQHLKESLNSVFEVYIPSSVKVAESTGYGLDVIAYRRGCKASLAYISFVNECLERIAKLNSGEEL